MASPVGEVQGAIGHSRTTFSAFASISTMSALSSRFAYSIPSPADTANSGLPPSGIVPTTLPAAGSMTEEVPASPFIV